jgi:aladin
VVTSEGGATQPLLKFAGMKGVACLAWQPFAASQLAVGCSSGVLLWTVDPASVVSRPSSSCVVRLEGLQGPATSVCWSPDGKLVAACSPSDTRVHIWSPASQACAVVHRRGGGGATLASWSPNAKCLFTATPASVFRVWETKGWTCDRWSVGVGRVAAAAWAPDSLQLVFATTDEPVLYCLSFQVIFAPLNYIVFFILDSRQGQRQQSLLWTFLW